MMFAFQIPFVVKIFSMLRFALAGVLLVSIICPVAAELTPDFLMDSDPGFRAPAPVPRFKKDFKGVWQQALKRPEVDFQRMAAETIARAHVHGIPDLIQLVPDLEAILVEPTSHPAARYAAARALITLESRSSAAKLFEAGLSHGSDLRQLVEPVMAEWDFLPARAIWIQRLKTAETRPSEMILAISGLGKVQDDSSIELLTGIVTDVHRAPNIRMEAALAAGASTRKGLEAVANQMNDEVRTDPFINRLCAVRLLEGHSSPDAQKLLERLAADQAGPIAAAALKRLNAIDSDLVVPFAENAMKHPDQHVREEGVASYLRRPTPDRIKILGERLSDDHPAIRKQVSEGLFELSMKPEFEETIRAVGMVVLQGDRWQGQSEAAMLLGALDHKPAADRLVELLHSTRPEVMVSTAWALRKLAEPRTGPAILEKIRTQTAERQQRTIPGVDVQVAHLFEACGVMKIRDVEPLMVPYIPKNLKIIRSRGGAVWAVGKIHEGDPDERICQHLIGRFTDTDSNEPEHPFIRQLSAISLARMGATQYVPKLRDSVAAGVPPTPLGLSIRWAIQKLAGEQLPEPEPESIPDGDWFLEPAESGSPLNR
jgi:HEAT repeat protein